MSLGMDDINLVKDGILCKFQRKELMQMARKATIDFRVRNN